MNPGAAVLRLAGACAGALGLALSLAGPASAQMFHLYLACQGDLQAGGRAMPAHIDLALRDNNLSALVQRSNVLPVGERMKYVPSPMHYSMVYETPLRSSAAYVAWTRYGLFTWYPDFARLAVTRLSIDRHSGALEGELATRGGDLLGRLAMRCQPTTEAEAPRPRF